MVALWIMIILLCLLTTAGGALIALRIQLRTLDNTRQEREAWQQAQEGRQRIWEVRQGKHILDTEKKLADQLKEVRREWRDWNVQIQQNHQKWRENIDLEQELARLPRTEEIELAQQSIRAHANDWHPASLYQSDLSGRDLSCRYLERADLRQVQLVNANLYMADLTGAALTGADLQQADLTGSNLSGADLRGANLSGANLLVADLHNAVLHGTNLSGARNLTPAQLQTAIYDSTTIIDSSIDITLSRIPGVLTTPPELLSPSAAADKQRLKPALESIKTDNSSLIGAEATASMPALQVVASNTGERTIAAALTTGEPDLTPTGESPAATVQSAKTSNPSTPSDEHVPVIPETATPDARETGKKSNATRKRVSKTRQATPLAPTFASKPEETPTHQVAELSLPASGKEATEADDEEQLSGKIIQLQERTTKTRIPAVTVEQNKDDQSPKKTGKLSQSSFFERSS